MTLAADHVCFRSSWSHLAAAKSAKHIVGELFECAGVPNARFGDALEILEEAMRALFVLHLIREDKYGRGEVAGEVGMREETLKKWLVMMVRGPELFRVRALSGPERAVAAVIERRFPHPDERARMEAEWRPLLDYNGIADEANIPIALQYQLLQDYYDRAGIRMNDRGTRAFLADRLNRAVTSLDVLPKDLASLVESGSFMTRDLSFWLTAEGFYVPVLKIMGGNPLRLLLVMICREGAADIERASRMAVNIFGKPFAFLNDDAKGYTGRFPMRFSAAVGIRNLNVPPSVGARWEGLIAHVKDAGPRDGSLSIAEAPEMLAMLEQRLGPTAGELPFSALTDEDRQELRLSRRSVVLAKADSATYAKRHIVGLGGALDGQPVQVAVMGDGVVAILETYGVVTDERGWSIKAGPSGGPLLLGPPVQRSTVWISRPALSSRQRRRAWPMNSSAYSHPNLAGLLGARADRGASAAPSFHQSVEAAASPGSVQTDKATA